MKEFRAALAQLGFKSLSTKVFATRVGDLVHAVLVNKDRYGAWIVSVLVCLPGFFKENEELTLENLQSPLAGDISPRGVIESWSWEKGSFDVDFTINQIKEFFKLFAAPIDVRHALAGLFVSPYFSELLPLDSRVPQCVLSLPEACYPVHGGALSHDEVGNKCRQHLSAALVPMEFAAANTIDVVAIKRRGEMFDAVRVVPDAFGTYVTLTCFPWPIAVWRVDKRWKDNYYPMLSYDVMRAGKTCLLTIRDFIEMDHGQLQLLLEDGIRRSGEVRNHLEFADQLGSDWAEMAAKLRRIPL